MQPFIWINLNPLYPRLLGAILVEIGPVALKLVTYFRYYLSFGNGCDPLFEKPWIHNTKGCLVPRMVEMSSVHLTSTIFNVSYTLTLVLRRSKPYVSGFWAAFLCIDIDPPYISVYFNTSYVISFLNNRSCQIEDSSWSTLDFFILEMHRFYHLHYWLIQKINLYSGYSCWSGYWEEFKMSMFFLAIISLRKECGNSFEDALTTLSIWCFVQNVVEIDSLVLRKRF